MVTIKKSNQDFRYDTLLNTRKCLNMIQYHLLRYSVRGPNRDQETSDKV